jgi:hypothetical protein
MAAFKSVHRVARMGNFCLLGDCFLRFLKIAEVAKISEVLFPRIKVYIDFIYFDQKWVKLHFERLASRYVTQ